MKKNVFTTSYRILLPVILGIAGTKKTRTDCYFNSVWYLGTLFADPLSFY